MKRPYGEAEASAGDGGRPQRPPLQGRRDPQRRAVFGVAKRDRSWYNHLLDCFSQSFGKENHEGKQVLGFIGNANTGLMKGYTFVKRK